MCTPLSHATPSSSYHTWAPRFRTFWVTVTKLSPMCTVGHPRSYFLNTHLDSCDHRSDVHLAGLHWEVNLDIICIEVGHQVVLAYGLGTDVA